MAAIIDRRVAAELDGSFVLFLIGFRINRPWKLWAWLPVFTAMPAMLKELQARPELGLLHARTNFGFPNMSIVQYWRSHQQLQAYAQARDKAHLPAWHAFNKRVGTSGDVGIWHETYLIEPGASEAIYVNMPPYGLGRAGTTPDAVGSRATAQGRLLASR